MFMNSLLFMVTNACYLESFKLRRLYTYLEPTKYVFNVGTYVERGSSAVECRTRNQESLGGGNASVYVHNCSVARMLPREVELVSE